jgi:ribonuclease P protein subunit POP4
MSPAKKTHIALELLTRAQPAEDALTFFKSKVLERPLYLKPTSKEDQLTADARTTRQHARILKASKARKHPGKPKPLSAKQKRSLQIYAIPKSQRKYDIYVPLWRMWCGYIREILGITAEERPGGYGRYVEPKGAGPLLAGADFHGAMVEVMRSRCVARVGVRGIVVRDTRFTFEIITKRDELKGLSKSIPSCTKPNANSEIVVLPKEHTVFRFEVPIVDAPLESEKKLEGETEKGSEKDRMEVDSTWDNQLRPLVFELQGSNFEVRATDRATRKFTIHLPKDL